MVLFIEQIQQLGLYYRSTNQMAEGVVSGGNGKGIGGYRWAGVDSRVDRHECHNAFPLREGSATRATASFEELALSVTWAAIVCWLFSRLDMDFALHIALRDIISFSTRPSPQSLGVGCDPISIAHAIDGSRHRHRLTFFPDLPPSAGITEQLGAHLFASPPDRAAWRSHTRSQAEPWERGVRLLELSPRGGPPPRSGMGPPRAGARLQNTRCSQQLNPSLQSMRVPTVTILTMAAIAAPDVNSQASPIASSPSPDSRPSAASDMNRDRISPAPTSISPPEMIVSQAASPAGDLSELKQVIAETVEEKLESERVKQRNFWRDRLSEIDRTRTLLNAFILIFTLFTIGGCSLFWLLYRRVVNQLVEQLRSQLDKIAQTDLHLQNTTETARQLVTELNQQIDVNRCRPKRERNVSGIKPKWQEFNHYADNINDFQQQIRQQIEELSISFQQQFGKIIQEQVYQLESTDNYLADCFMPATKLNEPRNENLADNLVAQAKSMAFEGKYEQAIAIYDREIKIKPDCYEAWYNRGKLLARLQDYESALIDDDKAIAIEPEKYQVWYSRGLVLENLQRDAEAIACYDRAISLEPGKYELWYERGKALERLQRYSEALVSYGKATAIRPDDCQLWYDRGVLLSKSQRYEEAIACYDRVVALKPDYPQIWHSRGVVLEKMQQYQEAIASYERAIALNQHDYESWRSRGTALAGLQKYQEAIACFSKAMEIQNQLETAANVS